MPDLKFHESAAVRAGALTGDLRSRIVSFDELMSGVDAQRYRDMPLVTTALWLARHRERLRQRD